MVLGKGEIGIGKGLGVLGKPLAVFAVEVGFGAALIVISGNGVVDDGHHCPLCGAILGRMMGGRD